MPSINTPKYTYWIHTLVYMYTVDWRTEIENEESFNHESRTVQPCPAEPINRLFVRSCIEGYEKQPVSAPERASVCVCVCVCVWVCVWFKENVSQK